LFARVSTYEIPPERADDAEHSFQQAIRQIRAMDGLGAAYLLVNAETGRVLTMTLWDTAAAMEASHVTASRLRTNAVRTVGGNVLSFEEYEVAARERRHMIRNRIDAPDSVEERTHPHGPDRAAPQRRTGTCSPATVAADLRAG